MNPSNEIIIDETTSHLLNLAANANSDNLQDIMELVGVEYESFRSFIAEIGYEAHPEALSILRLLRDQAATSSRTAHIDSNISKIQDLQNDFDFPFNKEFKSSKKTFALIIGANSYVSDSFTNLEFVKRDAIAISTYLHQTFHNVSVDLLTDSQATSRNIKERLGALSLNASKDDSVFIYFAGHAWTEEISLGVQRVESPDDMLLSNQINLSKVHELLTRHFNMEELITLCFHLGVDYERLQGEGLSTKARELVLHLERRNLISKLVEDVAKQRPAIQWPKITHSTQPKQLQRNFRRSNYFCAHDTVFDYMRETAITFEEFRSLTSNIRANRILLVLDACLPKEILASKKRDAWEALGTAYQTLLSRPGEALIAINRSARAQTVVEETIESRKIYTSYLLDALEGGRKDIVRIRTLYYYMRKSLEEEQIEDEEVEDDLIFLQYESEQENFPIFERES